MLDDPRESIFYHVMFGLPHVVIPQKPTHIRPLGWVAILCDPETLDIDRDLASPFVTGLMGATCKRCRERYQP